MGVLGKTVYTRSQMPKGVACALLISCGFDVRLELPRIVAAPGERRVVWMARQPPRYPALSWRKSTASADTAACVEVALDRPSVLVRDSRNASGPVLMVAAGRWREFVERIRNGDLAGH